ncbi:MAG: MlaD family protein [Armatimonadota bacterium]
MPADAKVGLVVVAGLLAFVLLGVWLGGLLHARGTYEIVVCFRDSQGLRRDAPIYLAGVRIGEVTGVSLEHHERYPQKPAAIRIRLRGATAEVVNLPHYNDKFTIETGTLLGDKYITVSKAIGDRGELIRPGDVVEGFSAGSVPELLADSRDLVRTLTDVAVSLENTLGDERVLGNIDTILGNFNRASADAQRLIASLARVTTSKEASLNRMVSNLEATSENFRKASVSLSELTETGDLPGDAGEALASIRQAAEDMKEITDHWRTVMTDETNTANIEATLAHMEEATDKAVTISENVAELTEDGKELIAESTAAASAARKVLERVDRRMTRGGQAFRDIEVSPRAELTLGFDSNELQLDADLFFRKGHSPSEVVVGLRDVGNRNRLNLQYGRWLDEQTRLRGGLIAGDIGVAVDRQFEPPWSATLEAYDQGPGFRVDVTGAYQVEEGVSGLFGVDNLFNDADVFVGGRYEF